MIKSLLTGSAGLFAMRISGAGVGFLTQIMLAKTLGSHDLGIFYSATSLATVAGFVTSIGYSQIAYRFSARYRDASKARLFKAFVSRAMFDGLACSVAAAVLVVLACMLVPDLDPTTRVVYAVAGATIVPAASLVLNTNLAGAMRFFGWCYVPDGLVRPIIFLGLIVGLEAFVRRPTGGEVMILFSTLVTVTALVVFRALQPHLPAITLPRPEERRLGQRWRREALPLVLLSLYTNTFADVAILFATPFLSQSDIAVFGVCLKLSLLVGYFVQIAQQIAIPDLADARGKGDQAGMRRAARRSILLPLAFTSAAVLGCFVLGRQVLGLFGAEFGMARDVLVIMVATQVVRAMAGPSAHLLTLTGAQRLNAALCTGALVALFAANWGLGPRFGPAGAAWAVVISYTGWIVATAVVVRRLGEMRTDVVALFLSRQPVTVAAVREAPAE